MDIEFSDISYIVNKGWKEKGEGRTILHGVSGTFRTGQLSAILGPSGAGKSTLLNILSGYNPHDGKGTININNKPINPRVFYKTSRYITQEDSLPQFLTVGEAMAMAASLKLPTHTKAEERQMIIDEKLRILGLQATVDTATEKLSGGQKKRLAIALELIDDPQVFFLDEPTSGLDNVTTKQILKLLRKLAEGGRTVVITIHQPSASLFDLFDRVYVLARGRCVYQGAVNNILPFLSSAGFRCPTYHNPADFVIEVVDGSEVNVAVLSKAMDNGKVSHSPSKERIHQLDYDYKSELEAERRISRQSSSDGSDGVIYAVNYKKLGKGDVYISYPTSGWHQFKVLSHRMSQQIWRNKVRMQLRLMHHIVLSLLVGISFYGTARDAEQMFNNAKFCTGYVLFHAYTNLMQPILVFPLEFEAMKKEYFNHWYGMKAYFFAYIANQIPLQIIYALIFNIPVYLMAGIPFEPLRFTCFNLIGILTVFTADAFGMAIGSSFRALHGAAMGPMIIAPFLCLSFYGLDFPKQIPLFVRVVAKLSFMRNGVIATLLSMYGLDREALECDIPYCHYKEPIDALKFGGLENTPIWEEIGTLAALMVVFRLISYGAMRIKLSLEHK